MGGLLGYSGNQAARLPSRRQSAPDRNYAGASRLCRGSLCADFVPPSSSPGVDTATIASCGLMLATGLRLAPEAAPTALYAVAVVIETGVVALTNIKPVWVIA